MNALTTTPLVNIDPAELDTPWEPTPVVWRTDDRLMYLSQIFRHIGAGHDHLVREVRITTQETTGKGKPLSLSAALEAVNLAETQFNILRTCGLEIARPEWHVFEDDDGNGRALARVPVIDGTPVDGYMKHGHPALTAVFAGVKQYNSLTDEGLRLTDIANPRQYVHGVIRGTEDQGSNVYLVDIEPVFY